MSVEPKDEPVLHCDGTDPSAVAILAARLVIGLYFYVLIFLDPPIAKADFELALAKLNLLISEAQGNHRKKLECAAQCAIVFAMIKQLLGFAKPICGNDIELINKSGFDSSLVASPHPLADKASVRKIIKGADPHTIKVMLAKFTGLTRYKKETRTYTVYVYDSMETEVFKIGCSETNSRKLIVSDVPFLTPKYYAVGILNAAGKNEKSDRVKFTLTD